MELNRRWIGTCSLAILFLWMISQQIVANTLHDMEIQTLAGNKAQIRLMFSEPVESHYGFAMDNPTNIVLDFPDVMLGLPEGKRSQEVNDGVARRLNFVEAMHKTRMVIKVADLVPYETQVDGNDLIIMLSSGIHAAKDITGTQALSQVGQKAEHQYNLTGLDFRLGESKEGRLELSLTSNLVPIDFRQEGTEIIIDMLDTLADQSLLHRYDVTDFGTPVQYITVSQLGKNVSLIMKTQGDFDKIAYQMNDQFVVEVRTLTKEEKEKLQETRFQYTGERLSLNFQDIEVRAVIQIIAEFTGLNIVTSDSVSGNVTLRLEDVPWDQALDMIMKSNGLAKREVGNVIMIAPNDEISQREQLEVQVQQQEEELSPLQSEFLQVKYAKAQDIFDMIEKEKESFLSTRGKIIVDGRTNTLMMYDTASKIDAIRSYVEKIDIPLKQVMIESQIVETSDNWFEKLGFRWGGAARAQAGRYDIGLGGSDGQAEGAADGLNMFTRSFNNATQGAGALRANRGLFVDLTQGAGQGALNLGLSLARLPGGTLIDLELMASEQIGKTKVISKPKIVTIDQQTAKVESGTEIPFATTSDSGTTTEFKKATISLEVTPQITPNEKVLLELKVNSDKPTTVDNLSGVAISTKNVETNVLVDNGDTIVLGGIFEQDKRDTIRRIPFLHKIPFLGNLFRDYNQQNNLTEMLVFVTPRIIEPYAG